LFFNVKNQAFFIIAFNWDQALKIIRLKPAKAQAGIGTVQYRVLHPTIPVKEPHKTFMSCSGDDTRKLIGGEQLVAWAMLN
tara:strand:- start:319 stop:561 length:243 start_codon:yes stop_codon:yes gene_type:complete